MNAAARKAGLVQTLDALAKMFVAEGWQFTAKPQRSLRMVRTPEANVDHTLLISEVLSPGDLPSEDAVGLSCQVNVYFADLEKLINRALGNDENAMGKLSVVLPLSQLAPKEHFYAGNVHLISLDNQDIVAECHLLRSDFARWLEPVRKRLENQTVFDDEAFSPPYVAPLSWELRRLAYFFLQSSDQALHRHIKHLEGRVELALQAGSSEASFDQLNMNGLKRTAGEISKLLQFCRDNRREQKPETNPGNSGVRS